MTLDQRARASAAELHAQLNKITVPAPSSVVRRARHRRTAVITAAIMVVAAVLTPIALIIRSGRSTHQVEVAGPHGTRLLPAGAAVAGPWTMIPKESAGIAATTLHALASDGNTLLLGGERPDGARQSVTMWRSDDGLHWSEALHPTEHSSVTAIGIHNGTALAIGAPGGAAAFVWRSDDDGRHWKETAQGDVFGTPAPNNRPGPFVSTLLWHDGWWIAAGGAADGYEGIWISRDGTQWNLVLDSHSSGSIDGIVETGGGALMAYGAGASGNSSTVEIGWFTNDPTSWGTAQPIRTPARYYLRSVAPGAEQAVGQDIDKHDVATPLLRSADGGHTWTVDATFRALFPSAWAWNASTAARVHVLVGTTTPQGDRSGPPAAWLSAGGKSWSTLPVTFGSSELPTTSIPQLPPSGALGLVASIGHTIVMMGLDASLDRYYTFDATAAPQP